MGAKNMQLSKRLPGLHKTIPLPGLSKKEIIPVSSQGGKVDK
jgi:hypothetical protein